jgi:hypothetical protein
MTINQSIESIFNRFTVNGVQIPIAFIRYHGGRTTYLTYQLVNDTAAMCADDDCQEEAAEYDFDIYTEGNFLGILDAVKSLLKANGWTWVDDGPDMYEEDTKLYHKTTTFSIEK